MWIMLLVCLSMANRQTDNKMSGMRGLWTNWIDYNIQWTIPLNFKLSILEFHTHVGVSILLGLEFNSIIISRHTEYLLPSTQEKLLFGKPAKKRLTLMLVKNWDSLSWFFSAYKMPYFHSVRKYSLWRKELIYPLVTITPFRNDKSCMIIWQLHRKP